MNQSLPTTLPRFFWHFIKKRPLAFGTFFFASCLVVLDAVIMPYILKLLVDGIAHYDSDRSTIFSALGPVLVLAAVVWVGFIVLIRLQEWWQAYVIPQFEADIRLSVFQYVTQHAYAYFADNLAGNLSNKISDLPRAIENIRLILCWNVISTLAVVLASIIILSTINPIFAIILAAWVGIHIIMTVFRADYVNRAAKINAEDKSQLAGSIVDTLTNILPVKLFARRRYELQFVRGKQDTEIASNKQLLINMNIYRLCMDILLTTAIGLMVYFILLFWQQGKISTGDFVFIFMLCFSMMNQIWHLSMALINLFSDAGVAQQALTLLNQPQRVVDVPDAKPLQVAQGAITFKDVTFHYHKNTAVFHNKNVSIKPGQKVGLVGFSGAGKSTFVNLILRFFDVSSGEILIDGQNVAHVTKESLRAHIAMIPQDTTLFHRSIKDNIRYGRIGASDEAVIAAAKQADCHDFINQLPQGYDTLVGERGIKLSGGQRQRIAIARAMLKDAPIVILDEATSSLDSVTEKNIQQSLHRLFENKTTIVVAHRLSTLSEMDRILVFDQGQIIEDGTHDALLKSQGYYAKLWQMQAGGFLPEEAND